jgi:hypothetical protein
MSKPETKRRKQRRAEAARRRQGVPAGLHGQLAIREERLRQMLLMAVDSVGGSMRLSKEHLQRATTLPMSLRAKTLSEEEGGGMLLELEVTEQPQAQGPVDG